MAASRPKKLGKLHLRIVDALKTNPAGLTVYRIRELLPGIGVQQHLDKRVRELRYHYDLQTVKKDGDDVYVLGGVRQTPIADDGHISRTLRAAVLNKAHSRCQMCGRSVAEDGIKLEIDHRIPRNWGGATEIDNLWAICQNCNGGKRDFFSSFDDATMKRLLAHESVYERIHEALKLKPGEPTPSWLLEFVANFDDFQEDWQKRLRELRYPVIGMEIKATRRKTENGRWEAAYALTKDKPLPQDHKFLIKDFERQKRARRTATRADE